MALTYEYDIKQQRQIESVSPSIDKYFEIVQSDGFKLAILDDINDVGSQYFYKSQESFFKADKVYYLSVDIVKTQEEQHFEVYLINEHFDGRKQFVKEFTVGTNSNEKTKSSFDMMFKPRSNFQKIVFKKKENTTSTIIYKELDIIKNILGSDICAKIGMNTNPGTILCVNGELIRVGKTGVYELRNDTIKINYFSVIYPGIVDIEIPDSSVILFGKEIDRPVNKFIFDYMTIKEVIK